MKRLVVCWVLALACGWASAGRLEATITTPTGQSLEDAALVVEPVSGVMPKRQRTVTIEQRDREFLPYVTIVQTGTLVEFPNRDQVKHHVYSFSPSKVFEIKLYAGKPVQPVLFDRPGEVALGCNIHDWMEAYVLVVNSPYFARSDARGHAVLRNLPAGRYHLQLWHPQQTAAVPLREIGIGTGTARLDLVLAIQPRVKKHKPELDLKHY